MYVRNVRTGDYLTQERSRHDKLKFLNFLSQRGSQFEVHFQEHCKRRSVRFSLYCRTPDT